MQMTVTYENRDYEQTAAKLRKLQLAELEILKKVTDVFEENGLNYYLGYGTLLGAIRHQGFIPWDDDVDVFLPRPDFDRFCRIADRVLPPPLFLNRELMPRPICLQHFMRIENQKLQVIRHRGKGTIKANVRVDIFPIDGVPKSRIGRKWLFAKARLLYHLMRFPRAYEDGVAYREGRPFIEKVMVWLNGHLHIGKYISAVKLAQNFDEMRRQYTYENADWVAAWTFDYGEQRIVCKKEWFGVGRKANFEGEVLRVPTDSEAVLHKFYGDFMTPPPEDQRISKHIAGFV